MPDEKISAMPDGSAGAQATDVIPFVSPSQSPKNVKFTLQELAQYLVGGGLSTQLDVLGGVITAGNDGSTQTTLKIATVDHGGLQYALLDFSDSTPTIKFNLGFLADGGLGGGEFFVSDNAGFTFQSIDRTTGAFAFYEKTGASVSSDGSGGITIASSAGGVLYVINSACSGLTLYADGTVLLSRSSCSGGQSIVFDLTGGMQFTASSLFNFSGAPCLFQGGVQTIEGDTFYAHTVGGNLVWTTSP